jgi:hypothetical protein
MSEKPLLSYFGHHKCGTTWIHSILTAVCKKLSLKIVYVHSPKQFNQDLETFIKDNHIDFLTYANADVDFIRQLKNFKGFHVIRDPRDIAVSSYFSHRYSHPTDDWPALAKHRVNLEKAGKSEGLFLDMGFIKQGVLKHLLKWDYHLPNVMEVKMEELTQKPLEKFREIFDYLEILKKKIPGFGSHGMILSFNDLEKIIHEKRFSALSAGRKKGEEDVKNHFRKGIPGDWINHFNDDHKQYFKENHNDLLIKLDYEKDENW